MTRVWTVVAVVLSLLSGIASDGRADDNADANALLVEAMKLINEARAAGPADAAAPLYEQALGRLDRIVDDYPSSNLAVQIITGQPIGTLDIALVRREYQTATDKASCLADEDCLRRIERAFTIARTFEGERERALAFGLIAREQAAVGLRDEAVATVELIGSSEPEPRLIASVMVAAGIARWGDIDAALQFLQSIDPKDAEASKFRAAFVFRESAVSQIGTNLAAALATLDRIEAKLEGGRALQSARFAVVNALAVSGKFDGAWAVASHFEDQAPRKIAQIIVALLQIEAGGLTEVLDRMASLEDPRVRLDLFEGLALSIQDPPQLKGFFWPQSGAVSDVDEAMRLAELFDDPKERAIATIFVIEALASAGDAQRAMQTAREMIGRFPGTAKEKQQIQVLVYMSAATALFASGHFSEAQAALDSADVAGSFDDERKKYVMATGLALAGKIPDAVSLIDAMHGSQRLLSVLAARLARTGNLKGALSMAAKILDDQRKSETFGDIAAMVARTADLTEILEMAAEIPSGDARSRFLLGIMYADDWRYPFVR